MNSLSPTSEDYLKLIWGSGEWHDEPITVTQLADRLGITAPTVSEAVKRLAQEGWLLHEPYGSIALTEAGRTAALKMVRRHRLLETFLHRWLGYGWDEVHDEAEILEHAVSDKLIERLDELLGQPSVDPHGDPIPGADGSLPPLPALQLSAIPDGAAVTVARVSDHDSRILQHLDRSGIALGTEIRVVERKEYTGTITIEIDRSTHELGWPVAAAIWVIE